MGAVFERREPAPQPAGDAGEGRPADRRAPPAVGKPPAHREERQICRLDHDLGQQPLRNVRVFRFAERFFEPLWNRDRVDTVQITVAGSGGVEHRAGYYDRAGCLRDMRQNHPL